MNKETQEILDREIRKAYEEFWNQYYCWPAMWVMCYRDPRLTDDENFDLAQKAVRNGWRP